MTNVVNWQRRMGLKNEIITRVVSYTVIYTMVSLIVIQKDLLLPEHIQIAIPLLFITYGIVTLISIFFCLGRYDVMGVK
ncbi:MAG: hypothetical protein ACRD9Q_08825 [Nitrososphaeraceae archaeon]